MSFSHAPTNRREVYLNFISSIESQLREAYAKRHDAGLETQTSLAKKLDVNRSVINRRLSGATNMEAETIADMVWALEHCIAVSIFDPHEAHSNHFQIIPVHSNARDADLMITMEPSGTAAAFEFKAIAEQPTSVSSGAVNVITHPVKVQAR